jgi:ABC-2 type transport system ATP-binding protein
LKKDVLAVTGPEPRRLRDALTGAEGISSLVLTGDGLHVVVDDAARRVPEFKVRLDAAHAPYDAMLHVAPSIEDLFVDAVSSRGTERG